MEDSGIDSPKVIHQEEDDASCEGSDSSYSSANQAPVKRSTTKQLQKKLEARIEQAKRIQRNSEYRKLPDNEPSENASSVNTSLIPIQRLAIPPKRRKHNTLIEYWHSDSESDDEVALFQTREKKTRRKKQDLTDTFSIEELSEEGSEDSLNLTSHEHNPTTRTYAPSGCFSCQCLII